MGTVLLAAVAGSGLAGKISVCERNAEKRKRVKKMFPQIDLFQEPSGLPAVDVVFLAIKPQDFRTTALDLRKTSLVVSVMAGVPISALRKRTGASKIVRSMPNTPARLGLGFTAWMATPSVRGKDLDFARGVFAEMGEEVQVRSEDLINKFTALSGSGPAYFFYSALALVNAARSIGIGAAAAERAARKTLEGAAALLISGGSLAERISQVASKGGTTEAALAAFKKSKLESAWKQAVRAAYLRAKELEKMSG